MNQNPVIIIGMHRSGTTLVSRLLIELKINLGSELTKNFESSYFQNINRSILRNNRSRWDNIDEIVHTLKTNDKLENKCDEYKSLNKKRIFKHHINLLYRLLKLFRPNEVSWGWKDPRNSLTLSFWLEYFPNAKIIYVVRNGIDVAISLHRRESERKPDHPDYSLSSQSFENCFSLWEQYNEACLHQKTNIQRPNFHMIKYEDLLKDPFVEIENIRKFLSLSRSTRQTKKAARIINAKRLDNSELRQTYSTNIVKMKESTRMKELHY